MAATSVWEEFESDPRIPQNAQLRASDADREVVHQALGRAFADGRLTREEFDQRSEAAWVARTLGELPDLLADLVPPGTPGSLAVPAGDARPLQEQALARYRSRVREALWGFLSASIVCWVIWGFTGAGGFPWPVFVMLGTGLHLGRTVVMRQEGIDSELRRLERRARRDRDDGTPRPLEPGDDGSG